MFQKYVTYEQTEIYIYIYIYIYRGGDIYRYEQKKIDNEGKLKCSYDDVISAVNDFFTQWVPSTTTLMEEVCEPEKGRC